MTIGRVAHLLAGAVALHGATVTSAHAQAPDASTERRFQFDLPAQSLHDALLQFSRITGLQVATSPATLRGLRSVALRGRVTAGQALRQLTSESCVAARIVGDTATITRSRGCAGVRPSSPASAPQTKQLSGGATIPVEADIIVRGFRESLARAEEFKRRATGSSDAIVAQDIAAFPEQNLAEALQRIPGVAITRDSGEGRQISLRGLGADFTRTHLNGMEVLTNTASGLDSRGSVNRGRSFDYSVFASELFSRVTIEKSYAAEQDEGGIGGTIALRTAKPFDFAGPTLVLSGKGQVNEHTRKLTPRAVALVSGHGEVLGALVSVAYSSADTIEYGYRNVNWSRVNFGAANVGPNISAADRDLLVNATGADRVWSSRQQSYSTWFARRERLGVTGALQYRPDARTDLTLDVLYGKLSNERTNTALGSGGTNGVAANDIRGTQVITDVIIDRYNSIVGATFDNVDLRSEARLTRDSTAFWQVALNGRTDVASNVRASGLAGWSRSRFTSASDQAWLETVGKSYSFAGLDTSRPRNRYGFDVTSPASGWDVQALESRADLIRSEFYNLEGELDWAAAGGSTFKVGGSFKQFANDGWLRRAVYRYEDLPGLPPVPTMTVPYRSIASYIIADVGGAYAVLGQDGRLDAGDTAPGTDFSIRETTHAAFLQYDLVTRLGDMGLRADVGLRYFLTRLRSKGIAVTGATSTPVSVTHVYHGVLPAMNLALDIDPALVVRVSAGRNVSRAALADMHAAATLNLARFGGTISAGNPRLAPFKADSLDVSLEYYDGEQGFLMIGAFYKKMRSSITTATTPVPYDRTGYPLSLLTDGQPPDVLVNFTRPVNTPGASIKGVEIAFKRDLDFLPAPLDHLGVLGNVTLADGSTDVLYSEEHVHLSLPQLSEFSSNATVYYEEDGWGVRLSAAIRGKYRVATGGNGNVGEYFPRSENYDASAYLNVSPRLKLTFEAINITDQRLVQYADRAAKRLMTNTVSGRTILTGATMRF